MSRTTNSNGWEVQFLSMRGWKMLSHHPAKPIAETRMEELQPWIGYELRVYESMKAPA